jgi:hypothetical protein
MLYDISRKKTERIEEDQLLDRIKCTSGTQPDMTCNADEIEEYRQACINLWCQRKRLDEVEHQDVKHICSLYLSPEDKPIDEALGVSLAKSAQG